MRTITGTESVKIEDASRLASYLRAHPDAFDEDPSAIGARFNLPADFVENVLGSLDRPNRAQALAPAISGARSVVYQFRILFRHLTKDPLIFIASTTAVGIAVFLLLDTFFGSKTAWLRGENGVLNFDFRASSQAFYSVSIATILIQQACYFRHGKIRFALLGATWAWVISAMTVMVVGWYRLRGMEGAPVIGPLLLLAYVMLIWCSIYAVISVVTSVLGGAYWVRKHEEAKEKRTRQELIEHLFELQDRIANPSIAIDASEPEFWRMQTSRLKPWFIFVALFGGIGFSLIYVSTLAGLYGTLGPEVVATDPYQITKVALAFVQLFLMSLVAYIGGRIDRAILAAVIFEYAVIPATLLPIEPFGVQNLRESFTTEALIVTFGSAVLVGALAALGAKIEERAEYNKKLQSDDRSALLAEVVRTEWQLELQTVNVCVLVVDVVRSSRMKAQANPLEVEYSFREYQSYVARICHLFEGIVHSTAGDGAVVAFYNSQNAFEAARRMQLGMDEFNDAKNRLKTPFRIRIGLHMGHVAGDIGDVQFSEVIDIAAHFESAAPPGGIALSSTIAEQLPGVRLQPLGEMVSGHTGYSHIPIEAHE